ncbi:MAG: hydroxysqualene dehydroxylase HpnE [Planctomycetota bacterium]
MNQSSETHFIVVGGGLAGIASSLKLARAGFQVTLLEAKRRLGGRAGSFSPNDSDDEQVDYCQHVGMGCCQALQQLTDMLGQKDHWTRHRELHFYGPTGRYSKLGALPILPAPLHIGHWVFKWPGLTLRDRFEVARGMLALSKLDIKDPEAHDTPALEWLRNKCQSESCISAFWTTVIVSALGEQTDRVSLYSVAKVFQDGFLGARDAFHLLVPNRPLDELFNHEAREALEAAGVSVRLSSPVQAVSHSIDESQSPRFQVKLRDDGLHANQLVLAVPWHQFSRLAPSTDSPEPTSLEKFLNATDQHCQQLQSSPITGVHTWWDQPWLETQHATIVNRLCQWVFPKPSVGARAEVNTEWASITQNETAVTQANLQKNEPNASATYYQIVISASRDLSEFKKHDLAKAIHDDLGKVFPRAKDAKLLRCEPVTDPNSVFSVRSGSAALRPNQQTEIPGLWLAGDWTQTGWPATMEGAILSGFRAADGIIHRHQH